MAVGILVRQTAGAVAILLVWNMLVESLVGLIPKVGVNIQEWLPFMNANHFLQLGGDQRGRTGGARGVDFKLSRGDRWPTSPASRVALLVVALIVAKRRDA